MALGTYFYLLDTSSTNDNRAVETLTWLPLTSLIIYFFAFSVGNGPIPFMMNGEIFAPEAKRLSSTLSITFNWLCEFFVTQFELDLEHAIGLHGACFLYGSICALAVVLLFFIPETKGKSSDELKNIFMGNQAIHS